MVMNFFYMQDPLVGGYAPEKVALRRAIALAFDGPALRALQFGGYGVPAQSTIPPGTSGYDPAYKSEMSDHDPARAQALLDLYGWVDRDRDGWREQPDGGFFLGIAYGPNAGEANDPRFALPAFDRLFERQRMLPDGPERDAVMRQAKNLLVAYMPYKVHLHTERLDLVQPWTRGYWRHPFMREHGKYVDVVPAPR